MMKRLRQISILIISFVLCEIQALSQMYTVLDGGTNDPILYLYADSLTNKIYAGGEFSNAGNLTCHSFAVWDGIEWDSTRNQFPSPPFDQIRSIIKYNNLIYAGGTMGILDTQNNLVGFGLAYWDSLSEEWIGDTVNGHIESFGLYNGNLLIGGSFDAINNSSSYKIMSFDGINFYPFPDLDTTLNFGGVEVMFEYNSELYVGGNFDSQISPSMKDIVKWDGNQWLEVGGGLSGFMTYVDAMTYFQGKLIIGGYFKLSSGDPGNSIAAWDGTQWSQLGSGVPSGNIRCLIVYKNELWVGGNFTSIGGIQANNIAKWDGTQWYNVGLNPNNTVFSFSILGNDLFIGGAFTTINTDTVNHIIKFNDNVGFEEFETVTSNIKVTPNPASSQVRIWSHIINNNDVKLILTNLSGEIISNYSSKHLKNCIDLNIDSLIPGMYFSKIINQKDGIEYTNFIKY